MNDSQEKYLVIKDHPGNDEVPLIFKKGEILRTGVIFGQDPEWPDWIRCTSEGGISGWAPVQYLKIEGDQGHAVVDYNSHELIVTSGETVLLQESINGWINCKNSQGISGWVPERNLVLL